MKQGVYHLLALVLLVGMLGGWSKDRRAYLKVLHAHTERVQIYHHLATAMNGNALLLTPAMRDALAQERTRLLLPDEDNRKAFAERMEADATAYHEVVLSIDSAMPAGERFGPGDGHWNLRMVVDGKQAGLVAVEHVRRPTHLHRSLYAFHDKWSEMWIARFERVSESPSTVELVVSGGYGNKTLKWSL